MGSESQPVTGIAGIMGSVMWLVLDAYNRCDEAHSRVRVCTLHAAQRSCAVP